MIGTLSLSAASGPRLASGRAVHRSPQSVPHAGGKGGKQSAVDNSSRKQRQKMNKRLDQAGKNANKEKENKDQQRLPRSQQHPRHRDGSEEASDETMDTLKKAWAHYDFNVRRAEWLVDVFRLYEDDQMMQCGMWDRPSFGLYVDIEQLNGGAVTWSFLLFCKLAVQSKVLPEPWDWEELLLTAQRLLPYALDKADAKEKHGGENIFSPMQGKPSLRFMAQCIYTEPLTAAVLGEMVKAVRGKEEDPGIHLKDICMQFHVGFFDDVGGTEAWLELERSLDASLSTMISEGHHADGDGMLMPLVQRAMLP